MSSPRRTRALATLAVATAFAIAGITVATAGGHHPSTHPISNGYDTSPNSVPSPSPS